MIIAAASGPSGAGKSVLVENLRKDYPEHVTKWQQCTTRARRQGEGPESYIFLSESQFRPIEGILTCVTHFNGNYYGTFPEHDSHGRVVLTIVDAHGVASLYRDVQKHNSDIGATENGETNGRTGKFGTEPVQLVYLMVDYDITDEAVAARKRDKRGASFARAERERLLNQYDAIGVEPHRIVTTAEWPSAEKIFNEILWPVLDAENTAHENTGELRLARARLESLAKQLRHIKLQLQPGQAARFLNDVIPSIIAPVVSAASVVGIRPEWAPGSEPEFNEPVRAEPAPRSTAADVSAAAMELSVEEIDSDPKMAAILAGAETSRPGAIEIDKVAAVPVADDRMAAIQAELTGAPAKIDPNAPVLTTPLDEKMARMQAQLTGTTAQPVSPAAPAPADDTPAGKADRGKAGKWDDKAYGVKHKSFQSLLGEHDFQAYIKGSMGANAFVNRGAFRGAVQMFMAENGMPHTDSIEVNMIGRGGLQEFTATYHVASYEEKGFKDGSRLQVMYDPRTKSITACKAL